MFCRAVRVVGVFIMDEKNGHYRYVMVVFNGFHDNRSVTLMCNGGYSSHGIMKITVVISP